MTAYHLRASGPWLRPTLAAVAVLVLAAATADARVIYRGIGNDDFASDIDVMSACLESCRGPGFVDARNKQVSGPDIAGKVEFDATLCGPGDIYIFHYAGHGLFQADDDIGEDPNDDDETIGINGVGLTDDELAAAFLNVSEDCTVLVINDNCYGGGFVGGSEDLDRAGIDAKDHLSHLATADKFCEAPGNSTLLERMCDALEASGGTVVADANTDGDLTMTEFFDYAANDLAIESYYDWDAPHDGMLLWSSATPTQPVPALAQALAWGLGAVLAAIGLWRVNRDPRA